MIPLPPGLEELDTAEAFLGRFGIPYDERVVRRARLHILQRFHDYLAAATPPAAPDNREGEEEAGRTRLEAAIGDCLARAYADFVRSDPLTERVFKVLKEAPAAAAAKQAAGRSFVPLEAVRGRPGDAET